MKLPSRETRGTSTGSMWSSRDSTGGLTCVSPLPCFLDLQTIKWWMLLSYPQSRYHGNCRLPEQAYLASDRKRIFSSGGKSSLHVLTATATLSRCSVPLNTSPKLPWNRQHSIMGNVRLEVRLQRMIGNRKRHHLSQQLSQQHVLVVQDPLLILHRTADCWSDSQGHTHKPVTSRWGYLDNRAEEHHARLLGDHLFGGEVVFDELRDGGEAGPFKAILTLPEGETGSGIAYLR